MREALQAYDRLLLHGGLGLHGRLLALRAAEQHTKREIDISSRKVGVQGAVQSAECRERTADFSVAEGLALPTDFLPCFLASALAALVRAFAISAVVWVLSFSGRRRVAGEARNFRRCRVTFIFSHLLERMSAKPSGLQQDYGLTPDEHFNPPRVAQHSGL